MTSETPEPRNRAERRAAERAAGRGNARRTTAAVLAASSAAFATTATLVTGFAAPAGANATETVNSTLNSGAGSLRQAIADVDDGGEVVFDLPAGSTITLNGQIVIDKNVTITGPGAAALTIDANGTGRIFNITDGSAAVIDVTISGLRFTRGSTSSDGGAIDVNGEKLTVTDSVFDKNSAESDGGAIGFENTDADLTILRSEFTGNDAGDEGGAIQLNSVFGAVVIEDSTVTGNSAQNDGGGIYAEQGSPSDDSLPMSITITRTDISGNTSGSSGGGVMLDDVYGAITITDSTITGNSSEYNGGGVFLEDVWDTVEISGTTISDNTADNYGGGLAIYNAYGPVSITGSVISGNHTPGDGGGIFVSNLYTDDGEGHSTSLTIRTTTVSGNTSGHHGGGIFIGYYEGTANDADVLILDSTIANNTADGGGGGLFVAYNYGTTSVVQSTITGNVAKGGEGGYDGGAIAFRSASDPVEYALVITQSTITGNTGVEVGGLYIPEQRQVPKSTSAGKDKPAEAGDDDGVTTERERGNGHTRPAFDSFVTGRATIVGTILAGNAGDDLGPGGIVTGSSSIFTKIASGTTFTDGGGNQTGVTSLLLGPLQDNGGPTKTMELLPGSPAIDKGAVPPPSYPTNEFDQRGAGYVRVNGGVIDVGAFEVQPVNIEPTFTG